MKNLLFLLSALWCCFFQAQTSPKPKPKPQTFLITYKVTYRPVEAEGIRLEEYMVLEVKNNKSHFYSLDMKKIDSMVLKNDPSLTDDHLLPNLTFDVYKDLSNQKIFLSDQFNQFQYVFEETPVQWKFVKNKPFKLKNYNIKQAETEYGKRRWIIEYTEDIPIFDGPYVFSGLPGIVYKAVSDNNEYYFEMMGISRSETSDEIKIPKANVTKDKIIQTINDFIKDPAKHDITYKDVWGDTYYYRFKSENDSSYHENNEKVKKMIESFNNPIDKDLFMINL